MIYQTISHYAPKVNPPQADKILEKLGQVPIRLDIPSEVMISPFAEFRISRFWISLDGIHTAEPLLSNGSRRQIV